MSTPWPKSSLTLVLWMSLPACGKESAGLLSDNLACKTNASSIASDVAALDTANGGNETAVTLGGYSTSTTQPGLAQTFTSSAEQIVWGVAIKLVAPKAAGGDVRLSILDNNIEPTSVPFTYATKTITAAQIGTTATWLLVDFGEFVALPANSSLRLGLTALYAQGDASPVSWLTTSGTGLDQFEKATIFESASWKATGRAGIAVIEQCL